jgi:alkylhydroperoxidase/carboxymuconolactone decarboxylase family protein YurZ
VGREAVEREMRDIAGTVLSVLGRVPDEFVEAEWQLLRRSLFEDTLIPSRYKALIGVAVAAALRSPAAARLHTGLAQVHGATDAELAEVVQQAAFLAGWATRISGLEVDADEFAAEAAEVLRHVSTRVWMD